MGKGCRKNENVGINFPSFSLFREIQACTHEDGLYLHGEGRKEKIEAITIQILFRNSAKHTSYSRKRKRIDPFPPPEKSFKTTRSPPSPFLNDPNLFGLPNSFRTPPTCNFPQYTPPIKTGKSEKNPTPFLRLYLGPRRESKNWKPRLFLRTKLCSCWRQNFFSWHNFKWQ